MAGVKQSKPKILKADTILHVDPKKLKPYEKNPRLNEDAVEYVMNSIKAAAGTEGPLEEGFKDPIEVDEDMVIICGHTRQKAAIKLGLKTVPIIVLKFPNEEAERMYRLNNNKVGEIAGWDFEVLEMELEDLKEEFNIEEFGFYIEDDDDVDLGEDENDQGPVDSDVMRGDNEKYSLIINFESALARDEAYDKFLETGYLVKKI